MKLFPDGLKGLLAPAAALPALLFALPLVELPVVLGELVVVPFMEDPVVVPLAGVPTVEFPPPDCASATVLVSASAVANPNVASLMVIPFVSDLDKIDDAGWRSSANNR
jgi:hypothetical protein